jgi:hypothetical protein
MATRLFLASSTCWVNISSTASRLEPDGSATAYMRNAFAVASWLSRVTAAMGSSPPPGRHLKMVKHLPRRLPSSSEKQQQQQQLV